MLAFGNTKSLLHRATIFALLMLLCGSLASSADARTRRHKSTAFQVVLQPFSLAHSAVHAVAAPIAHTAPRIVAEAATAPIRIAYRATTRRDSSETPRDEGYDEPAQKPQRARIAEPVSYAQPVQVAYVVPHGQSAPAAPQAEPIEETPGFNTDRGDDADEQEAEGSRMENSASKPMVQGSRAVLRNGIASAPAQAPQSVKNAIWAVNNLRRKPYVWGGGHGSFNDGGYDCSGTVSFALHGAGALGSPMPSSDLMRFGERGRGRWFTIYSRRGHTFAVIAGLRLDTTDFRNGGNTGPRWHADMRDTRGYVARHPAGM